MLPLQRFRDRRDAGARLSQKLRHLAKRDDVVVLALPRGGVPVGFEVARAIGAPLDLFVVRKLGHPDHEEFAMGAIASGGVRVVNEELARIGAIDPVALEAVTRREAAELARRESLYRTGRAPVPVRDRIAVLVDDGLATGSTMLAAVRALRRHGPSRVVVAVPIASPEACAALRGEADEIVCAVTPDPFLAVGLWYEDFAQTSDEEVRSLLALASAPVTARASGF